MTRRSALSLLAAPAFAADTSGPKARVPRPSPELAIEMVDGKTMLLSQFKGKVVLVEFLLTTCPHCQRASQVVQKLYQEFGPQGFQPVGVAINDMAKMLIPEYAKNFRLTFPIGFSQRDPVYNYLEHPPMFQLYMPTVAFLDRKFQIRAQHSGTDQEFYKDEERNMRSQILALLAEGRRAGAAKKPLPKN